MSIKQKTYIADQSVFKNQLITFDNFVDTILLFICRYCYNIDSISAEVPSSYNMTRRILTSSAETSGTGYAIRRPFVMTFQYDQSYNPHMRSIPLDIVKTQLSSLMASNGYQNLATAQLNNIPVNAETILKLSILGVYFISCHIKRVYLPLTNSYVWFYDEKIPTVNNIFVTFTSAQITSILRMYIRLLITGSYINRDGEDSVLNDRNLFKSPLYRIKFTPLDVETAILNPSYADTVVCHEEAQVNLT